MTNSSYISTIIELSQSEGGIFTTAQALRVGVPRDALSHAASVGRIIRIARGAYRHAASPSSELDYAVAIWKLTSPDRFTHERMSSWDGIAIGGRTAAFVHGIGDIQPYPCRVYSRTPIRTRLDDVLISRRSIDPSDIAYRAGMIITRPERTLFDLALDSEEPSNVSDALTDAIRKFSATGEFDLEKLRGLFERAKGRWGIPSYGLETIMRDDMDAFGGDGSHGV